MGCGVGRAVVSFRVLGTGGGCVVGKKEDVKLNSESSSPGRVPSLCKDFLTCHRIGALLARARTHGGSRRQGRLRYALGGASGGAGIDGALRAAGVQPKGCGRLKRVEETEG